VFRGCLLRVTLTIAAQALCSCMLWLFCRQPYASAGDRAVLMSTCQQAGLACLWALCLLMTLTLLLLLFQAQPRTVMPAASGLKMSTAGRSANVQHQWQPGTGWAEPAACCCVADCCSACCCVQTRPCVKVWNATAATSSHAALLRLNFAASPLWVCLGGATSPQVKHPAGGGTQLHVCGATLCRWRLMLRQQQLDQLKQVLEPRGVREGALLNSLSKRPRSELPCRGPRSPSRQP